MAHPQSKKEEGHLISGYHSQKMSASQWSGNADIQCLQEYPIFHFFFSTAWLNSPVNKATRDTCDLHNHTSPEQPSREKNLDRKFWKLERVAYLAMETDVHRDNVRWSIGNFNNPPGIWPSPVPGEGGLRVCGHAVFLYFWCGFAGIFILSCGIVVIKNQAVCGI